MAVLLKQFREKRHISQIDLARRSGVPQQTISMIECGERKSPGVQTLHRLCVVLKCTIDDIYTPDDEIRT